MILALVLVAALPAGSEILVRDFEMASPSTVVGCQGRVRSTHLVWIGAAF